MSDWLGEIKKRMKGPMLSASMTKGARRDMGRLISEVEKERALKDAITRLGNTVVEDAREQDTTIATLRATLVENTEMMFEAAKKLATIRKEWKKAKRLLLSSYASSSDTDGAIKIMEKALATTSSLSKLDNPNPSAP